MNNFLKSCQKIKKLKAGADKKGVADRTSSNAASAVAAEIIVLGQTQRLLTRVKNLGYVALAVSILNAVCDHLLSAEALLMLLEGYIDIPDDLN